MKGNNLKARNRPKIEKNIVYKDIPDYSRNSWFSSKNNRSNTFEYFTSFRRKKTLHSASKKLRTASTFTLTSTSSSAQNKNQIRQIMKTELYKKYNARPEDYQRMIIDNVIYNKSCHLVTLFKDYMIQDYTEEFLKRHYNIAETHERIPKFTNYYKNYLKFFCNPVCRDFRANEILHVYGENQAEVYYNQNYRTKNKDMEKELDMDNHKEEIAMTVFNTTIKDILEQNSQEMRKIDELNFNFSEVKNKFGCSDSFSITFNAQEEIFTADKSGILFKQSFDETIYNIVKQLNGKHFDKSQIPRKTTNLKEANSHTNIKSRNNPLVKLFGDTLDLKMRMSKNFPNSLLKSKLSFNCRSNNNLNASENSSKVQTMKMLSPVSKAKFGINFLLSKTGSKISSLDVKKPPTVDHSKNVSSSEFLRQISSKNPISSHHQKANRKINYSHGIKISQANMIMYPNHVKSEAYLSTSPKVATTNKSSVKSYANFINDIMKITLSYNRSRNNLKINEKLASPSVNLVYPQERFHHKEFTSQNDEIARNVKENLKNLIDGKKMISRNLIKFKSKK